MRWHDYPGRSDEPASEKRWVFHFEKGDKRWRETLQLFLRPEEAAVQEEAFLKQIDTVNITIHFHIQFHLFLISIHGKVGFLFDIYFDIHLVFQ